GATPTGTTTYPLVNCPPLSTSARYWILINTSTNPNIGLTSTGSPVNAYDQAGTCCTIPSSFTGVLGSAGDAWQLGVNLELDPYPVLVAHVAATSPDTNPVSTAAINTTGANTLLVC